MSQILPIEMGRLQSIGNRGIFAPLLELNAPGQNIVARLDAT